MAKLQTTYSGDLSQSIASNIWSTVGDAADDAHEERNRVEADIIAHNLKYPDRPFDPQFRKTHNILGHEIKGGDFFGSALKHRFTPNPLGLLGQRFHKKDFVGEAHLKGQSTPFSSPAGPFPKPRAAWAAKMAGQDFPNVAAGADLKHQVQSQTPLTPPKQQFTKTNDRSKAVVVEDKKLGGFFAAVALSLTTSLNSINKKLDDVDENVIVAKDGIAGTHKRLEHDSDTLASKLDQIIAAIREQISLKREEATDAKRKEAEDKLEERVKGPEPNSIVGLDDDPWEVEQKNEAEEQQGTIPGMEEEPLGPFKTGGSFIADGPQSGYKIPPLHLDGPELVSIVPLKTDATEGGKSGGVEDETLPRTNINIAHKTIQPRTEIYNLTQDVIGQQIGANKDEDPEVMKEAKNLQKAMDVVQKLTGIFSIDLFGRATSAMGPILGSAVESARSISEPISQLFGVQNTISNSISRDIAAQQGVVERKQESEGSTGKRQEKNFFQKLMGFFTLGAMGGGPSINRSGGGHSYARGGNTYNKGTMGGPVNNLMRWFNTGKTAKETTMSIGELIKQDWNMRQFTGGGPGKGIWNPFRWMYTMDAQKGGLLSGPTPLIREIIRRSMMKALSSPKMLARLAPFIIMEAAFPAPAGRGSTLFDEEGNLLHNIDSSQNYNQSRIDFSSPETAELFAKIVEIGSKEIEDNYVIDNDGNDETNIIQLGNTENPYQKVERSALDTANEPGYARYFTAAYTEG